MIKDINCLALSGLLPIQDTKWKSEKECFSCFILYF